MDVVEAYEFLQIDRYASAEEVSASFRRLLKEYHPDRNVDRDEWSHRMTVQLTEAYTAVTEYLRSFSEVEQETEPVQPEAPPDESDSVYSVAMQIRIAELYDAFLDQVFAYYNHGMSKVYLRQEGTLRYRFRSTLRRTSEVIRALRETKNWPGSNLQYRQLEAITDFAAAFYENMLIKPKEHQIFGGPEQKAAQLYRQGSDILDAAIREGLVETRYGGGGTVSTVSRSTAERALMLLLTNYPTSSYVPETLIKLFLFHTFATLCTFLRAVE